MGPGVLVGMMMGVGCESHYHERGTNLVTCSLSIYSLLGH